MKVNHVLWVQRGCQRKAVAKSLTQPMTCSEILSKARFHAPRIQLNDALSILKQLQTQGLVECLTTDRGAGKIYQLTPKGRQVIGKAFNLHIISQPQSEDWNLFAQLLRARTRREVFLEIGKTGLHGEEGKSASVIRKCLKDRIPLSLGPVMRALKRLEAMLLVERTIQGKEKRYVLTDTGRKVRQELLQRDELY